MLNMFVDEHRTKEQLEPYGIHRPQFVNLNPDQLQDEKECLSLVENSLQFPVVAKVVASDMLHKTECQAVRLQIRSEHELRETLNTFQQTFGDHQVLVEEYVPHQIEFILGAKQDKVFGSIVLFGAGGLFTELYRDVSFRKIPVSSTDISQMVFSTKIGQVFNGFRRLQLPLESIITAIQGIAQFTQDEKKIIELDVNPLIIQDERPVALDASMHRSE